MSAEPATIGVESGGDADGDIAVSVRNVYKLFGGDEQAALAMARDGASKETVQETHGSVLALSDVSFDVKRGELFIVMGLSGCGKSTLVRCINRLIEPTAGEIWLGDHEITSLDAGDLRQVRRTDIAMVFQHFGLMPHRNVLDNVCWGLEVNGVERRRRRERAEDALQAVGLGGWGTSMPDQLSGGMKQRVGLARALALDTPVLLMDEPFSALDPVIRRELQDELSALQERVHKTIVFITHDLSEAVRIGDRIAIMRDGAIVQLDAPTDVVLNPADAFVRDFTKEVRLQSMVTAETVMRALPRVVRGDRPASEVLDDLVADDRVHAMIVDDGGRYLGGVGGPQLRRAVRDGDPPVGKLPLAAGDAVTGDTVLDDLVAHGLRAAHAIPVVDGEGVLLGEIPLEALAEAMASDDSAGANGTGNG